MSYYKDELTQPRKEKIGENSQGSSTTKSKGKFLDQKGENDVIGRNLQYQPKLKIRISKWAYAIFPKEESPHCPKLKQ